MKSEKEHTLVVFFDTCTLQIDYLLFEDPHDVVDIPLGKKIKSEVNHPLSNVITGSVDHPKYVNNLLLK